MRNEKWQVAAASKRAAVSLSDATRLKETSEGGDLMDEIENSNRADEEKKNNNPKT